MNWSPRWDNRRPGSSTHLACLRQCGFVTAERRSKEVLYRLALEGLDGLLVRAPAAMNPHRRAAGLFQDRARLGMT